MPVFALWSAPRSRSTAFFRSMVERGDLLALHEPFWNVQAFGDTNTNSNTDRGGQTFESTSSLLAWLRDETDNTNVFFKETTDHRYEEVLADQRFLAEAHHGFLIRHPNEIVASYHALWPTMRIDEVGLETMAELHAAVSAAGGHPPLIIDSDDLVTQPEATMAAYCAAVGLRFIPESLRWDAGERSEWRRSADWHLEASASTGFVNRRPRYAKTAENTTKLAQFASYHMPFYQRLREQRLRIDVGTD